MLKLSNVSAGYNEKDIIKNVSFSVNGNESLSIIGPNGCGKTTLLRAILNILPFTGEILVDNVPISKMKHKEKSRKIAMLSQITGAYFSYSVYDTVMMGRYTHIEDKLFGLPSAKDKEVVQNCLKAVGLTNEADKPITELSGGQLQRVFLAGTLAQEPQIILLDEPTNHLDLKFQIELIEYMKKWASDAGRTVVGVMHDINLAMKLSDNIMVMKGGKVVAFGKSAEVITGELLEEVFEIDVAKYMRESLEKWAV